MELKWYGAARGWLSLLHKRFPYDDNKNLFSNLHKFIDRTLDADDQVSREELDLRADSRDFDLRFVGHCNTTTDIKEVNYLGIFVSVIETKS